MRGRRVLEIGSDGEVERQVEIDDTVTALATDNTGGFLAAVADRGVVLRFDSNWRQAGTWSLPDNGPVPSWPVGLAVDRSGRTLVVDRHNGRILLLSARGDAEGIGARQGWEPGLLLHPSAMDLLPNGSVLVADEGNSRVLLFRYLDRGNGR